MENDAHVNLKGVEKAEMEMEGGEMYHSSLK